MFRCRGAVAHSLARYPSFSSLLFRLLCLPLIFTSLVGMLRELGRREHELPTKTLARSLARSKVVLSAMDPETAALSEEEGVVRCVFTPIAFIWFPGTALVWARAAGAGAGVS